MRYRDPNTTWDETHDGDMAPYPETFVVCLDCGVAVYDMDAHDRHHDKLDLLFNQ
jgi:hypothetical protein